MAELSVWMSSATMYTRDDLPFVRFRNSIQYVLRDKFQLGMQLRLDVNHHAVIECLTFSTWIERFSMLNEHFS